MTTPPSITAALTRAVRDVGARRDTQATLDAIVGSAQQSLPGVDHVGVSVAHRDGSIETKAGTDELVWTLDTLQYELREGPCVHAIGAEPLTVVNHLRHEQRWQRYVPQALRHGVQAQVGIRLFVDHQTLGGLNLYATATDTVEAEVVEAAELFATYAALALDRGRQEDQLQTALGSRKVIGQALGMVMERFGVDEQRAFDYLTRVSSHTNTKLRDVAQQVVDDADRRRSDLQH